LVTDSLILNVDWLHFARQFWTIHEGSALCDNCVFLSPAELKSEPLPATQFSNESFPIKPRARRAKDPVDQTQSYRAICGRGFCAGQSTGSSRVRGAVPVYRFADVFLTRPAANWTPSRSVCIWCMTAILPAWEWESSQRQRCTLSENVVMSGLFVSTFDKS